MYTEDIKKGSLQIFKMLKLGCTKGVCKKKCCENGTTQLNTVKYVKINKKKKIKKT